MSAVDGCHAGECGGEFRDPRPELSAPWPKGMLISSTCQELCMVSPEFRPEFHAGFLGGISGSKWTRPCRPPLFGFAGHLHHALGCLVHLPDIFPVSISHQAFT